MSFQQRFKESLDIYRRPKLVSPVSTDNRLFPLQKCDDLWQSTKTGKLSNLGEVITFRGRSSIFGVNDLFLELDHDFLGNFSSRNSCSTMSKASFNMPQSGRHP